MPSSPHWVASKVPLLELTSFITQLLFWVIACVLEKFSADYLNISMQDQEPNYSTNQDVDTAWKMHFGKLQISFQVDIR